MKILNYCVLTIGIIGTLNWGLIGILDFNLIAYLFGSTSLISRIIYILCGICGLYMLSFFSKVGNIHENIR